MSAEIASLDRVRDAAEILRKKGVNPTADRIIEVLGGGGKATVLAHLRTIRGEPADRGDVPAAVIDLARPALLEIYRAGRSAEHDSVRASNDRLVAVISDLDAQIDELLARNEDLEKKTAGLSETIERSAQELTDTSRRLTRLETENDRLQKTLKEERAKTDGDLKRTLGRMEQLLNGAKAASGKAEAARKTITLPRQPSVSDRSAR